jgi:ABC-type Fe3+-hydroxamate transport system substrate-binding protein
MKKVILLLVIILFIFIIGCSSNTKSESANNQTSPPKTVIPAPEDNSIKAGMYKVGVDVQPGEYKIIADGQGYVEVAKDSSHSLYSIISNDNFEGEKYITIKVGQYIKLNNAALLLK